jgi:uncharacterized membrane protein
MEITWELLGTVAGVAAVAVFLTQFFKAYITKLDPKVISLIACAVLIAIYQLVYAKDYAAETLVMAAFKIPVATAISIGGFEGVLKPIINLINTHKQNNSTDEG